MRWTILFVQTEQALAMQQMCERQPYSQAAISNTAVQRQIGSGCACLMLVEVVELEMLQLMSALNAWCLLSLRCCSLCQQ